MGVVQEINLINNTNYGSISSIPTAVESLDSPFITTTGDMPGTSDTIGKPPKIISFHKQGAATFTVLSLINSTNLNTNPNGEFVELFNFNPSDYSRIIIDFILCNRSIEANTGLLSARVFRAFSSKLISLSYLSSNEPTLINGPINGTANNNGSTYIEDNNFQLQTPQPENETFNFVNGVCFGYSSPGPGIIPSSISAANPQMDYDSTNGVTKFGLYVTPNSTIKGTAKLM